MTDTRPLTHKEVCALWNQFSEQGGSRIRWSDEVQGYVTYEGDRFQPGTVEDAVRGFTPPEQKEDINGKEEV